MIREAMWGVVALVVAIGCCPATSPANRDADGPLDGTPREGPGEGERGPGETSAGDYAGHGVASVSPELLERFAPKPVAPAVRARVQAMLDVRAPWGGVVSNDGKRMFFAWTVTGTPQVWRLDAPLGFPVQLTGGEDTTFPVGLTADGKWLIVTRDRAGEENPGLYRMSTDGGPLVRIQHIPDVQTMFDVLLDDSRTLYFHANDRQPDAHAIYRYDLVTGRRDLVFAEEGLWSVADEKEGKLLLEKSVGSNMSEFFELDPASRALRPLFGQGEREDYVALYGAGAGEILVLTPKIGDFRRLYSWTGGSFKPLSPEMQHDVARFSIDRERRRVLYEVNEGGYRRLGVLDARTQQPLQLPPLPASDHQRFSVTSSNGRYATVVLDPGTSPPETYVVDWTERAARAWHRPSTPEIDTSTFARVTLESYPARDGVSIPMFVRRPEGCASPKDAPCPVVVSFHGGPESQAVPGFSTRAQLFVDAGFVYVEPNVRGSDGYGKRWLHADDGPRRLLIIGDIEDAARYIRRQWSVGGKAPRIGVYGGSYGGYSVLVAMTIFAGAYDVGVSVVGISSLSTFLRNTAPYRRILRTSEYGDPERDAVALEMLSPVNYVDRLQGPLLLVQGATDPRVPVGEAIQFHAALEKKGIPCELMIFPDEGHGMRKRPNQVLAIGHVLRFFETHLTGKQPAPSP